MDMSLFYTGAGLAASGGIVYALKGLPKVVWTQVRKKLVYSVRIYQYDDLFDMFERWLRQNYNKQYKDVEAYIEKKTDEVENESKQIGEVSYRQEENTFLIKYLNKKLLITKTKEKLDKAQSLKEVYFRKYTISGWGAASQINILLDNVVKFCKELEPKNEVKVTSNTSYGEWYSSSSVKVKPFESTILNSDTKSFIIDDIDLFLNSEQWYMDTGIPYKRGYCFYGPPGTGKTTLALALANFTKREVYCLNLNSIEDDSRLPYCIKGISKNSILLIEDIDKVFSGRDNIKESSKVTFSSLLNCLDGAFYKHGAITIITTNHIEKLDEALLRAGRIDVKIEIPKPSETEISEYLSLFYKKDIIVKGNFNMKMSEVQELCLTNRNNPEKTLKILNSTKNYLEKSK